MRLPRRPSRTHAQKETRHMLIDICVFSLRRADALWIMSMFRRITSLNDDCLKLLCRRGLSTISQTMIYLQCMSSHCTAWHSVAHNVGLPRVNTCAILQYMLHPLSNWLAHRHYHQPAWTFAPSPIKNRPKTPAPYI